MTREEVVKILLETDPKFKEWYDEHEELKWKVHKLDKHYPPDPELEAQEEMLKRRKLYLKDLMEMRIKEFMESKQKQA